MHLHSNIPSADPIISFHFLRTQCLARALSLHHFSLPLVNMPHFPSCVNSKHSINSSHESFPLAPPPRQLGVYINPRPSRHIEETPDHHNTSSSQDSITPLNYPACSELHSPHTPTSYPFNPSTALCTRPPKSAVHILRWLSCRTRKSGNIKRARALGLSCKSMLVSHHCSTLRRRARTRRSIDAIGRPPVTMPQSRTLEPLKTLSKSWCQRVYLRF
jgi:hypothetical protein